MRGIKNNIFCENTINLKCNPINKEIVNGTIAIVKTIISGGSKGDSVALDLFPCQETSETF